MTDGGAEGKRQTVRRLHASSRLLAWILALLLAAAAGPAFPAYERSGGGGDAASTAKPAGKATLGPAPLPLVSDEERAAAKPASRPSPGSAPALPSKLADRVVARVNGNAIALSEIEESVLRRRIAEPVPPEMSLRELYEEELNYLIDDELLLQAAERQSIEAPEEVVATQVEETLKDIERTFGSPESFREQLGRVGLTVEKIKNSLRKREERGMKIFRAVSTRFRVTDADALVYAAELKKKGESAEAYRLRHILILCPPGASPEQIGKARERAIDAAAAVHDGMAFDAATKKFSEDAETSGKGGELGFVEESAMMPALAEAVRKLNVGELSQPVRSDTGFHVFQLTEKRTPRKALFAKRFAEERKKWLQQLHRTETIETQMEFLDLLPE